MVKRNEKNINFKFISIVCKNKCKYKYTKYLLIKLKITYYLNMLVIFL